MKDNLFCVIKKRTIVISILLILLASIFFSIPVVKVSSPKNAFTIVIDAGHGGIDGGSVGINTGITENEINLEYAKSLEEILKVAGVNVVMTRTNTNGLYGLFSTNKKKDDMEKRKEIIQNSGAGIVISIHMNSFPLKSCRGAQVFYDKNNMSSKLLATNIQEAFKVNVPFARPNPDIGDYFILNCTEVPSVIVECGFLSNPEEEKLLCDKEHREKIAYSIFAGILLTLAV